MRTLGRRRKTFSYINVMLCLLLYGAIALFVGYSLIRLRRAHNPSFLNNKNVAQTFLKEDSRNLENHIWNLELRLYKQAHHYSNNTFDESNGEHKTHLVSKWRCSQHYHLLILVVSDALNYESRNSIRYTWGNQRLLMDSNATIYFLISKPGNIENARLLNKEQDAFNDILFGDINEDSDNLVYKTLFGLEWASKYCEFQFLFKTADNVFVSLAKIISIISTNYDKKEFVYSGHYVSNKKKDSPDYISGTGFIMNKNTVISLYHQLGTAPVSSTEDVYVGFLAKKASITPEHESNFEINSKDCIYVGSNVIKHTIMSPECMYQMFITCLQRGDCIM